MASGDLNAELVSAGCFFFRDGGVDEEGGGPRRGAERRGAEPALRRVQERDRGKEGFVEDPVID